MDPHSRRSQFNQRAPKSGPPSRNADIISTHKPEPKMPLKKTSTSSSETSLLIRRPIATNSRVKQDEIFKRDMYLSFVTNALQQKANVRHVRTLHTSHTTNLPHREYQI